MPEESVNREHPSNKPELLRIDPEAWRNYEFKEIELSGDLAKILRGIIRPEQVQGGQYGPEMEAISRQLREQNDEVKTSLVLTDHGKILLQVTPSVGTRDEVNNIFAEPPEGKKILEIHNHCKEEIEGGEVLTFPFFTAMDISSFAYHQNTKIAEAVVFEEGTAILLKTVMTASIIDRMMKDTRIPRMARAILINDLSQKMITEAPNDTYEERLRFTTQFAKDHAMRLLFVPTGEQEMQVII